MYDSSITLKINQTGNIYVYYYCDFCLEYPPIFDEIYINGEKQNEIKKNYDFDKLDNNVTLIFNETLNLTYCMFCGCSNITEVDLSNFDA